MLSQSVGILVALLTAGFVKTATYQHDPCPGLCHLASTNVPSSHKGSGSHEESTHTNAWRFFAVVVCLVTVPCLIAGLIWLLKRHRASKNQLLPSRNAAVSRTSGMPLNWI